MNYELNKNLLKEKIIYNELPPALVRLSDKLKIGEKCGDWTILSKPFNARRNKTTVSYVTAKCKCGIIRNVRAREIGKSSSGCGCTHVENSKEFNTKHGKSRSRIYRLWNGMKCRCKNPRLRAYRIYGAKGIKVCPEWQNFLTFHDWAMKNGYQDHLTINRKDSNKNYCPDNCEWVTREENGNVVKWRDDKIKKLELENEFLKGKLQQIYEQTVII